MSEPDPREERLPRWAKDKLRLLRMRLREREADLVQRDGAVNDAAVFVSPYAAHPYPVAQVGGVVEFRVPSDERRYFHVSLCSDGSLEVCASAGLAIRPDVSNSVSLEVVR